MEPIAEHFEKLSIAASSNSVESSSRGSESESVLEYYSMEDLLEEPEIKVPSTLYIFNYYMKPNIDFSNVTKLILGCVARIDTFDSYFKNMPKLEYFGYGFYTHKIPKEGQELFDPKAWTIDENYSIKHFELTTSTGNTMNFYKIGCDQLTRLMRKLKNLESFRTDVKLFHSLVPHLIRVTSNWSTNIQTNNKSINNRPNFNPNFVYLLGLLFWSKRWIMKYGINEFKDFYQKQCEDEIMLMRRDELKKKLRRKLNDLKEKRISKK